MKEICAKYDVIFSYTGLPSGGLPPPVSVVYQPPPWVQITTTTPPPSQVDKGPEEYALPLKVNLGNTVCTHTHTVMKTFAAAGLSNQLRASLPVDNDPHFIIHLPTSDMDVCFNIDSKPGHILNLLSDSGTGTK